MFRPGGDTFGRFHLTHEDAELADWTAMIDDWLTNAAERAPVMHHQEHYGHQQHHGGRRGPGMGGMLGGAAAGLVGGMVIADMMDGGLFDGDGGGEEEE
jgi:sporulation-control protein